MSKQLTDKDIIEFGMHKGKAMQDVPATWLRWFKYVTDERLSNNHQPSERDFAVYHYIIENMQALNLELKNKNEDEIR